MMTKDARAIAFYLPQFHLTLENDLWWGKGFTKWANTAKAKPMCRGHYQPHVPADLEFYDLRVPETREQQAAMAREYGIEAFCYYDYWSGGGRRILERPFNEMVANGVVLTNLDPEIYRGLLKAAVKSVDDLPADQSLVFLKSWNEWAEGNHLEPDLRDGTSFLKVVADVMIEA